MLDPFHLLHEALRKADPVQGVQSLWTPLTLFSELSYVSRSFKRFVSGCLSLPKRSLSPSMIGFNPFAPRAFHP